MRYVAAHRRPRTAGPAVPYVASAIVGAALAASWLRPGRHVASGDVAPFVRRGLAGELGAFWNHRTSGGGSTTADVTRAAEVVVARAVELVGGSPADAQHLLYVLLAAFAATGAAYLAGALVTQRLPVFVAGVAGVLNPFVLVGLPLPLPLLAIGSMGVLGGLVLRAARGDHVRGVRLGVAALPVSYLAINPPLVAVAAAFTLALAAAGRVVAGPGGTKRALGALARGAPWALALGAWWIVPFLLAAVDPAGARFAAETDVASWSWSHVDNDPLDVVSTRAHWGWERSEFYPFAPSLDVWWWDWLRWVLPATALVAPLLTTGRRRIASLALLGLVVPLVVAGKGLHAPFGSLNAWLYREAPGYWLLREPMSKVGACLVLVLVVLAAVSMSAAADRLRGRGRHLVLVGMAVWSIALVAYPRPLWTGTALPERKDPLPGSHVRLPGGWWDAARAVEESPARGKVLLLPLADYYQVTTNWGFHGADELVRNLVTRPVLQLMPGGYFADPPVLEAMLRAVEAAAVDGRGDHVDRLLRSLGVSHVVLRRDLVAGQADRSGVAPDVVAAGLRHVPGLEQLGRYGVADVYEVAGGAPAVRTASRLVGVRSETPDGLAALLAEIPAEQATTADTRVAVDGVSWEVLGDAREREIELAATGRYDLVQRGDGAVFEARVERAGGGTSVVIRDGTAVSVDGRDLAARRPVRIPVRPGIDRVAALGVGDLLLPIGGDRATLALDERSEVTAYGTTAPVAGSLRFGPVGDCAAVDARRPSDVGIRSHRVPRGVGLAAREHSACSSASVPDVRAGRVALRLEHRTLTGADARLCLWQAGPNRCAALPPLPRSERWSPYEALVTLEEGTATAELYVYADGDGGDRTVTEFRDASVVPLVPAGGPVELDPAPPAPIVAGLASGAHEVVVERGSGRLRLGAFSPVEDCFAVDDATPAEAGLAAEEVRGGVRLRASAHAACVWADVATLAPGPLRLRLEHRSLAGRRARVCVWQVGPNRCADVSAIPLSRDWQTFEAWFTPEEGTGALRVYLYADGEGSGGTVVEYRRLRLEAGRPASLLFVDTADAAAPPKVEVRSSDAGRFGLTVRDARGPFVLMLAESFAPQWEVQGLPAGATAEHLVVDGYANGWRIDAMGDLDLVVRYGPSQWVTRAQWTSAASVLLALVAAVLAGWRRRAAGTLELRVEGPFEQPGEGVLGRLGERPRAHRQGVAVDQADRLDLAGGRREERLVGTRQRPQR